ncbi:substrate-binding domain-containing protein, partial [Dactylosporangium sp. NPDC048998]|uniref:substrate-binding domain-containing protein n=1 Tax=Dactylosporangium sp. NPDC048998 TaxID=3363976 RepID=UPI0037190E21
SLGRRHIAHITGDLGYRAARDRAAALTEVLDAAGLPLAAEPQFGQWSQRWGRHATARLLAAHPDIDAIFCGNDQIASGAAEALRELGRTVPDDVALVGYDNWEVFATECRPPLTTVDLNLEQLGATAVQHLFAVLDGEQHSGVVRQPGRLIVRESTGVAPAR